MAEPVRALALEAGYFILDDAPPPKGAVIVKGEWPGLKMAESGADADAGPTGAPWVDSNAWAARLAALKNPGKTIWVDAAPKPGNPRRYPAALADAAAVGARWIVQLDPELAKAVAAKEPEALETWRALAAASKFFRTHAEWATWKPVAAIGVLSDYEGPNEFLAGEVLNLTARTLQPYRILDAAQTPDLTGLRAVICPDEKISPAWRDKLVAFAQGGGLVVVAQPGEWPGAPSGRHPRYRERSVGKGRIAVPGTAQDDPWLIAQDALVLLSHKHDLVRFWNGGSLGTHLIAAPGGGRRVLHIVNFSTMRRRRRETQPDPVTVWVHGPCKAARLWTVEQTAPLPLRPMAERGGVELQLPGLGSYAAIELEGA